MKKLLIAMSLALSACTAPVLQGSPPVSANSVTLTGIDALSKAADAYAGVTLLAEKVVRQDVLNPTQLRMLRVLNNQAIDLLDGADRSLTSAQRAAGVFLIITQMHSILGR